MARIRIDTKDAGPYARKLVQHFLGMPPEEYKAEGLTVLLLADKMVNCSDGTIVDGIPFKGPLRLSSGFDGLSIRAVGGENTDHTVD